MVASELLENRKEIFILVLIIVSCPGINDCAYPWWKDW